MVICTLNAGTNTNAGQVDIAVERMEDRELDGRNIDENRHNVKAEE